MNNKLNLLIIPVAVLALFAVNNSALASEVTGTLSTGISSTIGNTVNGTVIVDPVAAPVAGTYTAVQNVSLIATGASSIHYATDGTAPTCSTGTAYAGVISVGSSQTIQAISCYSDNHSSGVALFAYTINIPAPATAVAVSSGGGGVATMATPYTNAPFQASITSASVVTPVTPIVTTNTAKLDSTEKPIGQVLGAEIFAFSVNLKLGSTGDEVTELQKVLAKEGFFKLSPTGYFGRVTKNAVIAYQKAHAIKPASGLIGSLTRAELNKAQGSQIGKVLGASTVSDDVLRAQIATLQAQLLEIMKQLAEKLKAEK